MSKRPADEENVCSYYLERKKRPCRMKKADGMAYCPHHSYLGNQKNEKKGARIPCPLDPSHFCYETKLQKHLKKCNARDKEKPDYFIENINVDEFPDSGDSKVTLNDVSDDELIQLIKKLETLYNDIGICINDSISFHPVLKSEMETVDDGFNNFKHMKQQASLLSIMENNGLLSNGLCFIEFGAGKGQLMYWIVQCVPDKEKATFMLIDRSPQRHKSDNKFKGSDIRIERIRMDIKHLYLGKVDCIKTKPTKVVGVSKHLCGSATDMALKCLTNTLQMEENGEKLSYRAYGLLMALCCHHRCEWSSYVGKEFLKLKDISEREFKIMCCIASWATCGRKKSDSKNEHKDPENHKDCHNASVPEETLNRYIKLDLKHEEREVIGMHCKRILDAGRVEYMKKQGYEVKLVMYTEKSISLENVALLAMYKNI